MQDWLLLESQQAVCNHSTLTHGKLNSSCLIKRFSRGNNSIEGKFGISKTEEKTVVSTRVHDQGESSLCWDYASTSSLRKSLKVYIGTEHETMNLL